jgi:hypothetical protein
MRDRSSLFLGLVVATIVGCAHESSIAATGQSASATECPDAVTQSIDKFLSGATITSCRFQHHHHWHDQYRVKLDKGGEKVTVDATQDGQILQTEVAIALEHVPANVMTAFASKYPDAKPSRVEKRVRTGTAVSYEFAFPSKPKVRRVTFADDGSFVSEE